MPYPASSASAFAPRARALASDSMTKTAAPSPSTMPLRPMENGREKSGVSTRNVSHPRILSGVIAASLPPAMTRSTSPQRISRHAMPMDWAPDAQALVTAKVGLVQP